MAGKDKANKKLKQTKIAELKKIKSECNLESYILIFWL